ncbi:MAG TPA: zinc ribbon domain-containing protein [Vicinamibacterales bacterium]|jgi:putative FmdB family regulatory protein|nr:zinc ribbon domain-containing protein [Vicinamibacterales bacterium]
MPLFEYVCRECDRRFEVLVRGSQTPECPSCHGSDLERRQSTFAAHTASSAMTSMPAAGPCGACGDPRGAGACSRN